MLFRRRGHPDDPFLTFASTFVSSGYRPMSTRHSQNAHDGPFHIRVQRRASTTNHSLHSTRDEPLLLFLYPPMILAVSRHSSRYYNLSVFKSFTHPVQQMKKTSNPSSSLAPSRSRFRSQVLHADCSGSFFVYCAFACSVSGPVSPIPSSMRPPLVFVLTPYYSERSRNPFQ
jgi:hypothetical protein